MSNKLKIGKKSGLRYFGYDDIKTKWGACYDPIKYLPVDWRGTAVDMLNNESIPFSDRLWCVLRTDIISDKVMRLFAVWSYRQTLKFISNPDPRSIEAANVAERFALGQASEQELSAAESAAESARTAALSALSAWSALSAARTAAESAESAAWSAALSAAWSAAESAAESAWSAALSAAESAAWSAAESAAWSAAESAESAALSAARTAQKEKLIEMIIAEVKERKAGK